MARILPGAGASGSTTILFGTSVRSHRARPLSSFLSTVRRVLPFPTRILALGDTLELSSPHAADERTFLFPIPASFLRPDHQLLPDIMTTASRGSLVLLYASI